MKTLSPLLSQSVADEVPDSLNNEGRSKQGGGQRRIGVTRKYMRELVEIWKEEAGANKSAYLGTREELDHEYWWTE